MASLKRLDLVEILNEEVISKGKPFLGICLGMHFLANESEELGVHSGLGWIDGSIRLIRPENPEFKVPHVGWNNIDIKKRGPLFEGFEEDPVFYFVHSYHFEPVEAPSATCWHGISITAAIQKDHIFGVQFHPEKSQQQGLKVLENFIKII